jgi:hypothetical protein
MGRRRCDHGCDSGRRAGGCANAWRIQKFAPICRRQTPQRSVRSPLTETSVASSLILAAIQHAISGFFCPGRAAEANISRFSSTKEAFLASLAARDARETPYRHWLLEGCLPAGVADALAALPFEPASIEDTYGKRDSHNESRIHFGRQYRSRFEVMDDVARVFQDREATEALKEATGAPLSGTSLRIEYCQDTGDFWLEPHTDIGVKRFTFLIYLNREPEAADWGTDIYSDENTYAGRAPAGFTRGLIFVPSTISWHGFEKRGMKGVRKTLIINYVGPEWRNRHELSFPEEPVQ